jgi:hypothetical protein
MEDDDDRDDDDGDEGTAKKKDAPPSSSPTKVTETRGGSGGSGGSGGWSASLSQNRLSTMWSSWLQQPNSEESGTSGSFSPQRMSVSEPMLVDKAAPESILSSSSNSDDIDTAAFEEMLVRK